MRAFYTPLVQAGLILALVVSACGQREPHHETTASPGASVPTVAPPRPNVVLFLIDTLRADRLGVYGYSRRPNSPHMDALAAEGVVFDHACAPSPWTIPSVASIFTSRPACEHNVLSKYDRLPDSWDTLAERLSRAGYTTHSMYGNAFLGPEWGMRQGFVHARTKGRNDGPKLAAQLGPNPRQPFFVYIHNMEPHDPYHYAPKNLPGFPEVSQETRGRLKMLFKAYKSAGEHDYRRGLPLGTNDLTEEQERHLRGLREAEEEWEALYDASVSLADDYLGSAISMLKNRGLWSNTLFILVSDHGEEMNDHGGWLHDQSVYDELMRVPLIVKLPQQQLAGTRIAEPVSLLDLMPTICDAMGRPSLAKGAAGRSLMPLIHGQVASTEGAPVVFALRHNTTRFYRPWSEDRGDVNVLVRRGCTKGIWNVEPDTFELYDTCADPGETRDLAPESIALTAEMHALASSWYRENATSKPAAEVEGLDDETVSRLRAMGYAD